MQKFNVPMKTMTADEIVELCLRIQAEGESEGCKLLAKALHQEWLNGFNAATNAATETFLNLTQNLINNFPHETNKKTEEQA